MWFHLQLNRKYCCVMFKVLKLEYMVVSVDVSDSFGDIIILSSGKVHQVINVRTGRIS